MLMLVGARFTRLIKKFIISTVRISAMVMCTGIINANGAGVLVITDYLNIINYTFKCYTND